MNIKFKNTDAMHFSKYHEGAQNPQGLLCKLFLYGPFRRLLSRIGLTHKNKQLTNSWLGDVKIGVRVSPLA